ncbi:hypothetical protein P8452_21060 [Trifolium repens]|nr:hypothetical protein P8452_21060 [Trifolium repens]
MAPKINFVELHQSFHSISLSTPSSLPHRRFSCSRSLPRPSQSIPRPSQSRRVGAGAPVYLAAVLEYLLAVFHVCNVKSSTMNDEELSNLVPKKAGSSAKAAAEDE